MLRPPDSQSKPFFAAYSHRLLAQGCTFRYHRQLHCCMAISLEGKRVEPVRQSVTVSAPATVANLGPGFDWLGCAVQVRLQALYVVVLECTPRDVLGLHMHNSRLDL